MSSDVLCFAGRLMSASAPLGGARIVVTGEAVDSVVASGLSSESGHYRIELRQPDAPALFKRIVEGSWLIQARGIDAALLVQSAPRRCKPGLACITDLDVGTAGLAMFQPVGAPLERLSGGLFNDAPLELIDAAIATHFSQRGTDDFERYAQLARRLRPRIAAFGRLLDDAWGALDGHPGAERALRATLTLLGASAVGQPARPAPASGCGCAEPTQPPKLQRRAVSAHAMPARLEGVSPRRISDIGCLLQTDRLIATYAATARIARDTADAANLVAALELGLCGFGRLDSLVTSATEALATGDARGLKGQLDHLGGEFDPFPGGGGPLGGNEPYCPDPIFPDLDQPPGNRCLVEPIDCFQQLRTLGGLSASNSPPYVVASISDIYACPGSTITILGSNFGSVPGLVCFPFGAYFPGGTCVQALSWTDTEVRVVVPLGAGSGELYLSILERTEYICGKFFGITREGVGARLFLGGSAAVSSLVVNGGQRCAEPGATVDVSWVASNGGTGTAARLRVTEGTNLLFARANLADTGTLAFTVPQRSAPTSLLFTLDAVNPCGSATQAVPLQVDVFPQLTIAGVEITQGVQTFAIGGGGNNALPTIASKDTIVRVYVACARKGFLGDECAGVSGRLRIGALELAPINGSSPTNPGAINPFITARLAGLIDRTQTDHTLNFRIPAAACQGNQQLDIAVFAARICGSVPQARLLQAWAWSDEPALKVRYVRIRDDRPGGTGSQPTDLEAQFTLARAFDLLPSPVTDIAPARRPELSTSDDFTSDDGLGDVLDEIDARHDCSFWDWLGQVFGSHCPADDHALWIGFTVPFNRGLAGRPGNSAVGAIHTLAGGQGQIQRFTPAHELSHNLGFMHVNRMCSGSIGGPFYNHPNSGDLQQVPFDPFWNVAIGGTVQDFMSYGCSVWTSEDSWGRLRGAI